MMIAYGSLVATSPWALSAVGVSMGRSNGFRVLVATDGSTQATRAITAAAQFPWPARTRVRAVVARRIGKAHSRSILLAALDRGAEVIARAAQRRLRRRWPDADVVIVDKAPVDGVLSEVERFAADVVVLGWRGHGPIRRLLMGSVSTGVVRGARCPVFVVKRRLADVRKIVIGVEGSPVAQRAVAFVKRLEVPQGGSVTLFTALEQTELPVQALPTSAIRAAVAAEVKRVNKASGTAAKRRLRRIAATLEHRGWRVRTVISTEAPLRAILATVAQMKADVMVVGARGCGGVRRLLLGSVAEGVLNDTVLVVR
jgi:nucleotide-binding universal stress UspA family protein